MKKLLSNKLNILTFFAIFCVYPIEIINANLSFSIRTGFKLLFSIIFFILFLKDFFKNKKTNIFIILFFVLSIFTVLITIYNKGNIFHSLYYDLLLYNVFLIIIYLNFKNNIDDFFIILNTVFSIYVYIIFFVNIINFIFKTNFESLSNYNDNFNFYIWFLISSLYIFYKKNSLKYNIFLILTVFLMFFDCISKNSFTTLISITLFLVLFFVKNKNKLILIFDKIFNPILIFLYNLIFFVSVVLVNTNGKIGEFIGLLLGKELSFGQRLGIWNVAISRISKNPIGYGIQFVKDKGIHIENVKYVFSAFHNIYLETVYESGIVGIVILLIIITFVAVNLSLIKDRFIKVLLSICFFILLFRFQIASEFKHCFSGFLSILYFSSEHFEKYDLNENIKKYLKSYYNYFFIFSMFVLIPIYGIYILISKSIIFVLEFFILSISILVFIKNNNILKFNKKFLFFYIYFIISILIILNTIFNKGMIVTAFHNQFLVCNLIILIVYNSICINKKYFFINIYLLYFIYVILHLCLNYYILNIGHLIYLFDNENYHWHEYFVLILSFLILYFIFDIKNNKFLNYSFIFSLFVMLHDGLIVHYSLTTLLISFSTLFLIIIIDKSKFLYLILYKIFNPFLILIYNVFFWFLVIYENVNSVLFRIISFIFNKQHSSGQRMLIWKKGVDLLKNNVFGLGIQDKGSSLYKIFINDTLGFFTFHNIYLEFWYDGGIIVIILLLVLLFLVSYNIYKINNKKIKLMFSIILFFLLMRYQVETGVKTVFILILAIINFMSIELRDGLNEKN